MKKIARMILTPGEPAGIGPDIVIKSAQLTWNAELIVIADPALLLERAKQLNLPLTLMPFDREAPSEAQQPGFLKIISLPLNQTVKAGHLNPENSDYVIQSLTMASDLCQQKIGQAIVTGPVHKGVINEAGIPFTGHTEFFARQSGKNLSLMLFVTPQTKVALMTTHLPLSKVPAAITQEKLRATLQLLYSELSQKFGLTHPRMTVCGLNPHAGEQGHLGREEIDIISPVLNELRNQNRNITGPVPADTVFTDQSLQTCDAVLAMYHDQALPVVKYMSFGHAVNVTLGLPYIRTSVDHGVALDVAGTQKADESSLVEAIKLAIALAP